MIALPAVCGNPNQGRNGVSAGMGRTRSPAFCGLNTEPLPEAKRARNQEFSPVASGQWRESGFRRNIDEQKMLISY